MKDVSERNAVYHRIRNAKASLDNAEKSFQSNADVRGELDLMLAEAELQSLRRKRPAWMVWTRRSFAVLSALVIIAAGGVGCLIGSIGRETTGDERTIAVVVMPQLPIWLMTSSR